MTRKTRFASVRFVYALLIALMLMTGLIGAAQAQSAPIQKFEEVNLTMQSGWEARGRHAVADDFVVTCPIIEVLDPNHPCSSQYNGSAAFDDLVLVCPTNKVLDPHHPCGPRRAQIARATPDKLVLVCPVKEVLDPSHPCAQQNAGMVQVKIPGDYVMTCPVKEVLEPGHPCARSR